jgi:hypothetical protein
MKIGRGNRSTWRKPTAVSLCPPQIPHDPASNMVRRGGMPATNCLRYGSVASVPVGNNVLCLPVPITCLPDTRGSCSVLSVGQECSIRVEWGGSCVSYGDYKCLDAKKTATSLDRDCWKDIEMSGTYRTHVKDEIRVQNYYSSTDCTLWPFSYFRINLKTLY